MHWREESFGVSVSGFELPPTFFDGRLTNRPLIIEVTILCGSEDMRGGEAGDMVRESGKEGEKDSPN